MATTLYSLSGSPYAWRVWLTLEFKSIAFELRTLSYDAGDFRKPEFRALNARGRVPVLVDDGFVLCESAAIVEYLEDRKPAPPLFAGEIRARAIQRRMIREIDQYYANTMERLVDQLLFTAADKQEAAEIAAAAAALRQEFRTWESLIAGDFLAGAALSAVDITLYPLVALTLRIAGRRPDLQSADWPGPKLAAWRKRMEALAIVQRTWPPNWKG